MTHKVFVLDTSVILSEGRKALYAFGTGDIILPLVVVRELEKKRHDPELGYTARSVLRELLVLMRKGDITQGVPLGKEHGTFRIETNHIDKVELPATLKSTATNDIRILSVAKSLGEENPNSSVVLVTKDIELKIVAEVLKVPTEDLQEDESFNDEYIQNLVTFSIDDDEMNALHKKGRAVLNIDVPANTGVILRTHDQRQSAIAISKKQWNFEKVPDGLAVHGKVGRSAEQKIAMSHLMDESIGVVSLSGTAGSGKSFMMLAAALELMKKNDNYQKIVVFRPVNPVGGQHQELGFLPGDLNEKLAPHTVAIWDTLGTIMSKPEVDDLKRRNVIEFASISHVRGRTLANCIVILDELQNVEASTILTLISRLGINARVFVGWDTAQRDAQFIGKYDGIVKVVRHLYGKELFSHTTLKKSERSAISNMVSGLLDGM